MTSERVGVGVLAGLGLLALGLQFLNAVKRVNAWVKYQARNERKEIRRGAAR